MTKPIGTVMLIDDERADRYLYRMTLEESGLVDEVLDFAYAEDALQHLKEQERRPVDVIFLDIRMPRMDGFEFLEAATRDLGADFASVLIVMLTTSLDPSDVARARSFDVVREYINKPLETAHVERAAELLRRAR